MYRFFRIYVTILVSPSEYEPLVAPPPFTSRFTVSRLITNDKVIRFRNEPITFEP